MEIGLILRAVGPPTSFSRPLYMPEATDAAIVEASLNGDDRATEELIRRYWDEAARSALLIIGDEHLAEDVAQEAFLAVLGSLKKFDPERPFGPWLHRIAVNKAIDRARKSGRDPRSFDPHLSPAADGKFKDSGGELGEQVLEALALVDPEDRAMLVARYVLNYRAVELAEWFGMPAATVRVRVHRAAARVRQLVEKGESDGSDD